ncbi:MAG: hypothetical protein KGI48_10240, partial [Hyphomicrobiales bacterium]|nr:hypothetical protein [Hyphomicrobiales bacterium]
MGDESEKSKPSKVKANCKNCGSDRWAIVVAQYTKHEALEDETGIWARAEFRILQCPACDDVFFQTDSIFSEDYSVDEHPVTGEAQYDYTHTIEHWPPIEKSRREKPTWLDKLSLIDADLLSLFSSVYVALDREIDVLAAIGIRTVFDRASELLSIDPTKGFA